MVEAPVGWQCPECTSEGAKKSRQVPAFTRTSRGRTGVVGSTNPTPIVLVIIAVNVVVFFLEGFGTNTRVVDRFAMYPIGVHFQHQYYRAFTAMWLHASFRAEASPPSSRVLLALKESPSPRQHCSSTIACEIKPQGGVFVPPCAAMARRSN